MQLTSVKHIAILGSTGSIGTQTLDIVRRLPERLRVTAIAAGSNGRSLVEQAMEFGVSAVALVDNFEAQELEDSLPKQVTRHYGTSSLETLATRPDVDIVVVAVNGAVGVRATIAALKAGKTVALATKEVLVAAGELVMDAAKNYGGRLIPIDSEHSGVLQCLQGNNPISVKKIWLTASGGPFRDWSADRLATVTVEEALKHPTWSMGRKITVDSATMMNKGLETIEAQWLFDTPIDKIGVVVHPQSKVHALVQYNDGSVMAQIGNADMRLPIEYALLYPERLNIGLAAIDVLSLGTLEFFTPDEERFPSLRLAREAAISGGTMPAVLNAANEAAVQAFLNHRLPFLGIAQLVEKALGKHNKVENPTLNQVVEADEWARRFVSEALLA